MASLAIPCKRTEPVDLISPLERYCTETYGKAEVPAMRQFFQRMQAARNDVAAVTSLSGYERSERAINLYLAFMNAAEERFPIKSDAAAPKSLRRWSTAKVRFVYSDALANPQRNHLLTAGSLLAERCACVYNLAALKSQQAADVDRSSREGTKQAKTLFCEASGLLDYLAEQHAPALRTSPDARAGNAGADMSAEGLNMMSFVMLAQAQYSVYQLATREGMARGVMSKVARQAAHFLEAAAVFAARLGDSISPHWHVGVCDWRRLMAAAAHYHAGLAEEEVCRKELTGFGACVARLRLAKKYCSQLEGTAGRQAGIDMTAKVDAALASLEKDNNSVYHELITPEKDIKPLPMQQLVWPIKPERVGLSVQEAQLADAKISMSRLMPQPVRAAMDEMKSAMEDLRGIIDTTVESLDSRFDRDLEAQSISQTGAGAVSGGEGDNFEAQVPDALWEKIADIQAKGGAGECRLRMEGLFEMDSAAQALIASTRDALSNEKSDDDKVRERFGGRWDRRPSLELTSGWRQSLDTYERKLNEARTANSKIQSSLPTEEVSTQLALNRGELGAQVPHQEVGGPEEPGLQEELSGALAAFQTKRKQLHEQVAEMKAGFAQINPTVEFIELFTTHRANPTMATSVLKQKQNQIISDEREKVAVVSSLFTELGEKELVAVLEANEALQATRRSRGEAAECERSAFLRKIDAYASATGKALGNLGEGAAFFERLMTYLSSLQTQASDFQFARTEEKNGRLATLTSNMGAGGA